jgi:ketosteroid isomerase-like protein
MLDWPTGTVYRVETDGTEVEPLVHAFFSALEAMDFDGTIAVCHEDIIVEYPTSVPGIPARIEGREAFAKHEELSFTVAGRTYSDFHVYNLGDPSWCLTEHVLEHTFPWEGGALRKPAASIFAAREGKLVYFRQYFHSAAIEKALEHAPARFKGPGDGE